LWLVVILSCAAVFAGLLLGSRPLARLVERRANAALQRAYDGQLEVKHLQVSLFPHVLVNLQGISLHRDDPGGVLLITINKAVGATGYWDLLRRPLHIRRMTVDQLEIHVPPRKQDGSAHQTESHSKKLPRFVIDELVANGTKLEILPKDAGKLPLEFDIHDLTLTGVSLDAPMKFRAILTNAKPPGDIHSTGTFGPWQLDDPAETPVQGTYTFRNADLSVFKGIAGTLSSEGKYQGVLDHINVQGQTDTPDFTVKVSGNPVHLVTQFQAVVDGMNGDTRLDPVNGQFGHSSLVARGLVHGTRGEHGKTTDLDVEVSQGRLEDMLRLGVKGSQPSMTGAISFHTKLEIPPGPVEIPEKLILDGQFAAEQTRFAQLNIQERVDKLSARGRGDAGAPDDPVVASNFQGRFTLKDGVMNFQQLSFQVPGVQVGLDGNYGLLDEKLDLHGTAQLKAKLSQTVTGFKSFLLKPLDPFFRKGGVNTSLRFHIGGTRSHPTFGLDLGDSHKSGDSHKDPATAKVAGGN
jgi:hypothetical protein